MFNDCATALFERVHKSKIAVKIVFEATLYLEFEIIFITLAKNILSMREIESVTKITIYPYIQLSESDKKLISAAKEAMKGAYAPYSNFKVGAAVACNDTIVIGSNQENEAYPSGMCAERVALYSASAQNPGAKIATLAIVAYNATTEEEALSFPCGACRQTLLEYERRQGEPIRIIVAANDEAYIIESVKSIMPLSFNMK